MLKYFVMSLLLLFVVGCRCDKTPQPEVIVKTEKCQPRIVYQDRIVVEEKPVVEEKVVYKEKIVYKDKIIYRDRPRVVQEKKPSASTERPTIGRIEYVRIISAKKQGKAKIDTGAKTTSVDARDIERFERDGKEWVKFKLLGKPIERPLVKNILIKRHGTKPQRRAVVKLRLQLGEVSRNVLVTLADRDQYNYPILIGRNFLRDTFVVDVSKTYTVKPTQKSKKSK